MNTPLARHNLPWLTALTATAVTLLWHGGMFGAMVSLAPSDNEQLLANIGEAVRTLFEGLLVQGGIAFLIAQRSGERGQPIAFERPAMPLLTFGGALLVRNVVVLLLYRSAYGLLVSVLDLRWIELVDLLGSLALDTLGTWLAWKLVLSVHRGQAIVLPPPAAQRGRAAGLAGWLQATCVLVGAYAAIPFLGSSELYDVTAWLAIWVVALVCAALAFGGAWLALPRQLSRVHVGRLLGAGLLATACAQAFLAFAMFAAVLVLWGAGNEATALIVLGVLALLSLLAVFGFQWLWTRLCYAGPRRSARTA